MEDLAALYGASLMSIFVVALLSLRYVTGRYRSAYTTNPLIMSALFFSLIHIIVPLMQFSSGFYRYRYTYSIENHITTLAYALSVYLVYYAALAYSGAGRPYTFLAQVALSRRALKRLLGWSALVALVGAWAAAKNFYRILTVGLQAYLSDRIALSTGSGLQILLAHWLYIAAIMFYFAFIKSKHSKFIRAVSGVACFGCIALALVYYSINSNRNSIFLLTLNLMVVHFAATDRRWRRPSLRQLKRGIAIGVITISCTILFYEIGKFRRQNAGSQQETYRVIQLLNGAFGNHENIQWLIEENYRHELGSTYVAAITNFVPRRFWEDKPLGGGPKLKNMIWPGSYVVGQPGVSSLTTGLITELAMNFGFIVSIPVAMLMGGAVSLLLRRLRSSQQSIVGLWYIVTVVTFSAQIFYAEFLGLLARYVVSVAPFALIWLATQLHGLTEPSRGRPAPTSSGEHHGLRLGAGGPRDSRLVPEGSAPSRRSHQELISSL